MGNSGSGLPYEDTPESEAVTLAGSAYWTVRGGKKIQADERGEQLNVSIFRFNKAQIEFIPLAQRNWQKLRKLRHPYIVSVLDGIDLEAQQQLLMVTEQLIPLQTWEARQTNSGPTAEEVIWGLKCILEALDFVHVNCSTLHGYLGPHAIFVAKNGDWKLGAMDFACVLAEEEDVFAQNERRLDDRFRSPERRDGSWGAAFGRAAVGKPSGAYGAMDIYALGVLFRDIRDKLDASCGLSLPSGLDRCIQKMVNADFKKRPVCKQILRQEVFVSGAIALMSTLNELALKPPLECMEILQGLKDSIGLVTMPVCTHKVLPVVARTLRMCNADFQNRDSRESCRQMVQTCTSLLAGLITEKKVDAVSFSVECLAAYLPLWTMSDRAVRTELLKTLKAFTEVVPPESINQKIFDNMMTGFSDSNAKMREDTLKNLVCVVSMLDERNLQEKLVRCMSGLQADSEPSIRTNATIFLGRIAPDIKEAIRFRVLPGVFVKAMKDGFIHCRVAGVRAASACIDLIDITQLCGKVLPQVCLLLLDPCQEVRELAMEFVKTGLGPVGKNHQRLCRESADANRDREQKRLHSTPGPGASSSLSSVGRSGSGGESLGSGGGGHSDSGAVSASKSGGWTSWAVDGLSKTIEKAVLVDQQQSASTPTNIPTLVSTPPVLPGVPRNPKGMSLSVASNGLDAFNSPSPTTINKRSIEAFNPAEDTPETPGHTRGGWGDSFEVDSFELDFDDDPVNPTPGTGIALTTKQGETSVAVAGNGWDEDDDWMNELNDNNSNNNNAKPTSGGAEALGISKETRSIPTSLSNNSINGTRSKSAKEKPPVSKITKAVKSIGAKKMKVDKDSDNWDDF